MPLALRAGAVYFLMIFAAGFALGVVRTLLLEPELGRLAAVAVELPAMLVLSWLACCFCVRRFRLPARLGLRATMGAVAFGLLMAAELALFLGAGLGSTADFAGTLAEPAGALGLAGQVLFGLMPVLCLTSKSA